MSDEPGIPKKFKAYRQTQNYQEQVESISDDLHYMLADCEVIGINHTKELYEATCMEVSKGSMEFNDGLIVESCKKHNFTLVTDDFDFVGCNIPIISANRHYK